MSHRSLSYHVGHLSVDVFDASEFSDDTCTLALNFNLNPILNETKVNLSQSVLDSTLEVKFEQFQWTVFQKSLGNLKKKTKNVLPSEEVNIFFYGNCRRDNENIFFLEILMIVTPSSSYAVC